MTVGLPRSGKTTWAQAQGCPIVNRDAIRLALHGQAYVQEAESIITGIEDCMVRALFLAGHDKVIVDATHTTDKRRKRWHYGEWNVDLEFFIISKDECIERAKDSNREDLVSVIERMSGQQDFMVNDEEDKR